MHIWPNGQHLIMASIQFWAPPQLENSNGNRLSGGVKYTGIGKIGEFRQKSPSSCLRYKTGYYGSLRGSYWWSIELICRFRRPWVTVKGRTRGFSFSGCFGMVTTNNSGVFLVGQAFPEAPNFEGSPTCAHIVYIATKFCMVVNQIRGKFFRRTILLRPWPKMFVTRMLTRDLFAVTI